MKQKVRKAVIPAAGFGTRLLPATKSQPKEMIPVVDKPVIQYVVEEAVASGIRDILIVIGKGKRAIEEHFDRSYELEMKLHEKNRDADLEHIRSIADMADIHFIWQKEQNGLGDAVLHAKHHVGDEPFVVLLGDTIIEPEGKTGWTTQLIHTFEEYQSPIVALEEVAHDLVSRYGVIDGSMVKEGLYLADGFIEKPPVEEAPSNLVIASRYILTADIFPILESLPRGYNNEIQLADAMKILCTQRKFYGQVLHGTRYDVGNKLDFIRTNISLGLHHPEIGDQLRTWLQELISKL